MGRPSGPSTAGSPVSGGWTADKTVATFPVTGLQSGQAYDLSVVTFTDVHADNQNLVVGDASTPVVASTQAPSSQRSPGGQGPQGSPQTGSGPHWVSEQSGSQGPGNTVHPAC